MSNWIVDKEHPHIKRRVIDSKPEYDLIEECVHYEWAWSNEKPFDKFFKEIKFNDLAIQRWGQNAIGWYEWFFMMKTHDDAGFNSQIENMYNIDPSMSIEDVMDILKDYHTGWQALHRKLTSTERKNLKKCALSMNLPIDIQGQGKIDGHASPLMYHKKVWDSVFPNEKRYV